MAGVAAGSVVLFGFGLDSLIEVLSALVVFWRLLVQRDEMRRAAADSKGIRMVGLCFITLAVYVTYDSGLALFRHETPSESVPGIIVASSVKSSSKWFFRANFSKNGRAAAIIFR